MRENEEWLLGGAWAPITDKVLFVQATAEQVAEGFHRSARGQHIRSALKHDYIAENLAVSTLADAFAALVPLHGPVPLKHLIVPTTSRWTAIFIPTPSPDLGSEGVWMRSVGFPTVLISHAWTDATERGGGSRAIYFWPEASTQVAFGAAARQDDNARWTFEESPLGWPGERPWDPYARFARNRFTRKHLETAAEDIGIRFNKEDFYAPRSSILLLETGGIYANHQEFPMPRRAH